MALYFREHMYCIWFCTQTHTACTQILKYRADISNLNLWKTVKISLKKSPVLFIVPSGCVCVWECVLVNLCFDVCMMHYMIDFHVWHSFSMLNLLFIAFRDTSVCATRHKCLMLILQNSKKHFRKDETLQNTFCLYLYQPKHLPIMHCHADALTKCHFMFAI